MSFTATQTAAIESIVRETLLDVSPEELVLVDDYFTARTSKHKFDGMLGIGVGGEILLVLPILNEALKALASTTVVDLAKEWGQKLADWIAGPRDRPLEPKALQTLAHVLKQRLEKRGFSEERASQVSDCVITTLVSKPSLLANLRK